jgi:hypothetical protein
MCFLINPENTKSDQLETTDTEHSHNIFVYDPSVLSTELPAPCSSRKHPSLSPNKISQSSPVGHLERRRTPYEQAEAPIELCVVTLVVHVGSGVNGLI